MSAVNPGHRTEKRQGWRIRPARASDRAFLEGLASRLAIGIAPWRSDEAMAATARGWLLADLERFGPDAAMFLAETLDGEPLGAVAVASSRHFTGAAQAEVGELAVVTEWEGRGVGAALLASAEACRGAVSARPCSPPLRRGRASAGRRSSRWRRARRTRGRWPSTRGTATSQKMCA